MKNRLAAIVGSFAVLSIVGLAHQAISKDPIRVADRVQHRMQLALVGEDETVTKRVPEPVANQQPARKSLFTSTIFENNRFGQDGEPLENAQEDYRTLDFYSYSYSYRFNRGLTKTPPLRKQMVWEYGACFLPNEDQDNTTAAAVCATYTLQKTTGHASAITLRQLLDNAQMNAVIEASEQTLTVTADAHTQKFVIDLIAAMDAR